MPRRSAFPTIGNSCHNRPLGVSCARTELCETDGLGTTVRVFCHAAGTSLGTKLGNSFRLIFDLSLVLALIFSSPYSSLALLHLADTDGITSSYVAHGELHVSLNYEHPGSDADHRHGSDGHNTAHETTAANHGFSAFTHTDHHHLHLTAERFYSLKASGGSHTSQPLAATASVASDFFNLRIPTTSFIPPESNPPGLCSQLRCLRTTVLLI